jgi:hypothetical protein
MLHFPTLFEFYGFSTAHDRFNLYQGRQRTPDMMINMLLDGGKKYNETKRGPKKSKTKKRRKKKMKKKKEKKENEEKGKEEKTTKAKR